MNELLKKIGRSLVTLALGHPEMLDSKKWRATLFMAATTIGSVIARHNGVNISPEEILLMASPFAGYLGAQAASDAFGKGKVEAEAKATAGAVDAFANRKSLEHQASGR